MGKLSIADFNNISASLNDIRQLDKAAKAINDSLKNPDEIGDRLLNVIGRHNLPNWRGDVMASFVVSSIINQLMLERGVIADSIEDLVEIPDPPFPTSKVQKA